MKNKKILSIISVILLLCLSACNNNASEGNSDETSPAIPLTSQSHDVTTGFTQENKKKPLENEDLSFSKDGDGGTFYAETPQIEDVSAIRLNTAYIVYAKPGEPWDGSLMKVKENDILDNGLAVTWSEAYLMIDAGGNEYVLYDSKAEFKGKLTLTGTLHCIQENSPVDGGGQLGSLWFVPDAENDVKLPFGEKNFESGYGEYFLGKVTDENMPEEISKIVNTDGKEDAKVKVTISSIEVDYSYGKAETPDKATIESIEEII